MQAGKKITPRARRGWRAGFGAPIGGLIWEPMGRMGEGKDSVFESREPSV